MITACNRTAERIVRLIPDADDDTIENGVVIRHIYLRRDSNDTPPDAEIVLSRGNALDLASAILRLVS